MENDQWSQFKLRVNIQKDTDAVYHLWSTANGLERWFLRNAIFKDPNGNVRDGDSPIQQGDTYEWYWHGYPDSVVEKGKVLKADGRKVFSFTFSMDCPVTVSLYTEAGETIVELIESDLPTDETTMLKHYVGDSRGWIFYLINLKSILEGGVDLRNKKVELVDVITS